MQGTALHRFLAVICMKKRAFVFLKALSWKRAARRGAKVCGARSGLRTAAVPPEWRARRPGFTSSACGLGLVAELTRFYPRLLLGLEDFHHR